MSRKAVISSSVPTATARGTTTNKVARPIQRHNSEELTAIDISPPRRRSKLVRGINPVFVENTVLSPCSSCDLTFLAGYSWILGPVVLLIWRVLVFVYVLVTLVVIAVSDIARLYTFSLCIYCAQLVCCCVCVLCSCLSVFGGRKGFRKRNSIQRKSFALVVDTASVILLQNVITLCLYNDIVVSIRDEVMVMSKGSFELAHWYNLLPACFELVLGCAEFEPRYYAVFGVVVLSVLGSALAARHVPWMPYVTQVYEDVWDDGSSASAVLVALQMAIIATLCCVAVLGAQKGRQALIRLI